MKYPISPTPDGSPGGGVSTSVETPSALLAEVYIYVGQEQTAKYSIEHGEYLIGRDETCHIVINADRVSRHHARLTFSAYELVIEDFGSSNGVFIEGVQVQLPTRLHPDQELQIGTARLYVRLNDATARQLTDALWDADLGLTPVRQQLEGKKYKALTTIARGGMGIILQARDLRIRRNVAMKVMKTGAQFSRESVLRFIDEAQLTGQLEHPNIVPVYELGIDEHGETFYTMKFVKGITLDEVLRGLRHGRKEMVEKYPLASLITIFQKICDGVAFAHAKGVIHRDLKPENVMIGAFGEVLVMDWGLAKQTTGLQRPEGRVETALDSKPRDPLRGFETMHGVVIGTPPYISPEQARGELDAIDVRSDVYVLGAILYAILSLRATVQGDSVDEVLGKITSSAIKAPLAFNRTRTRKLTAPGEEHITLVHCPGQRIPEGLSAIAMKALRMQPEERYQTVEELQADLTSYQGGFATKAERASLWRQILLFAGRHKREFGLFIVFGIIIHTMLVIFVVGVNKEKDRAIANEKRARTSELELARAIEELRGTAPTYAQEAASLVDDQKLEEALEKIEYAIEQVPNEASYHLLRGHILQAQLRFNESSDAYNDALRRNPSLKSAKDNVALNAKISNQIGDDGQVSQPILRELHAALVEQKRMGEALALAAQVDQTKVRDRSLFVSAWKSAMGKRGLPLRIETKEDDTYFFDLSKVPNPDLRRLHSAPVSGLNLDDTRVADLTAIKGLPLTSLSLSHTPVRDLSPLVGMPLRSLVLDGTPVMNLTALSKMPLESLRVPATLVQNLTPLRGLKLEQLNLAGCRAVRDLEPLSGMPLERLDLSRTGVRDLRPLVKSPLRELNLDGCVEIADLTPLLEITTLESVLIPAQMRDVAFLRDHPNLKRLSYKKITQPIGEFWDEQAKRAAK